MILVLFRRVVPRAGVVGRLLVTRIGMANPPNEAKSTLVQISYRKCFIHVLAPTSAVKPSLNEGPSLNAFNQNPCDLQKQRWHLAGKGIIHAKGEIAINAAGQQVMNIWEGFFQGGITTTVASGWKGTNNERFESLSWWFVNVVWPQVSGGELVPSAETSPVVSHCFKHHGIKLSCSSLKTDGSKQQKEGILLVSLTLCFARFVLRRLMLHAYVNTK